VSAYLEIETKNGFYMAEGQSEVEVCTRIHCVNKPEDDQRFIIQCNKCKRKVHYRCTGVPAYHLQTTLDQKLKKRGNIFACSSCVDVDKDIADYMPHFDDSFNESLELADLTQQLQDISFDNETTKDLNTKLVESKRRYRELLKISRKSRERDQEKMAELEKELQELKEKAKGLEETNKEMKAENEALKASLQENQIPVDALLAVLNPRLNELESNIFREMRENQKQVADDVETNAKVAVAGGKKKAVTWEDQIQQTGEKNAAANSKLTYSEVLQDDDWNTPWETVPVKSTKENFKAIMKEMRDDEMAEERDKKRRSCNIIIRGAEEMGNKEATDKNDKELVQSLMETIGVETSPKALTRLGEKITDRQRPIKVILNSEEVKKKILSSLPKLKGNAKFEKISVSEDLTVNEREILRTWHERAKIQNAEEPADSEFIWRVRGSPKNGWFLKRLKKKIPIGDRTT